MKKKFFNPKQIFYFFITLVLFFFVIEIGLRSFCFFKNIFIPPERNFSRYLGWQTQANDSWTRFVKGFGKVHYSTTKFGFRVFGDPLVKNKIKIFVIGDSFTQATQISDGFAWYNFLQKMNHQIELFVYGCDGYGTLQEFMILDKYFDLIKPGMILWQFSGNDFINNCHELESASFVNNNQMVRPYYNNGKITWLYPSNLKCLEYHLVKSFYLLRLLNIYLHLFAHERFSWEEPQIDKKNPIFRKAAQITEKIFELVKKRVGKIPIVAFGYDYEFPDICQKHGIYYIPQVFGIVDDYKKSGVKVDGSPFDSSHWNQIGQRIAGKVIFDYLILKGFIKNPE